MVESVVNDIAANGGQTAQGLDFVNVGVSISPSSESQVTSFASSNSLHEVYNDPGRSVLRLFSSVRTHFVVLNGVAGSPSHQQWEVVYSRNFFFDTPRPSEVQEIAAAIASVAAPAALQPPTLQAPPSGGVVTAGEPYTLSVAAGGSDLTYRWFRDGELVPSADAPSLHFPAIAPGDAGTYTVEISNGAGTLTTAAVDLRVLQGFATWADLNLLPAGSRGPRDDPDGDGTSNLLEFFGGTDPTADSAPSPQSFSRVVGGAEPIYRFTFRAARDRAGLSFALESSADLTHWTTPEPGEANAEPIDDLGGGPVVEHAFSIRPPAGGPRFYRLRMTLD